MKKSFSENERRHVPLFCEWPTTHEQIMNKAENNNQGNEKRNSKSSSRFFCRRGASEKIVL
jgi:hypothetical protein